MTCTENALEANPNGQYDREELSQHFKGPFYTAELLHLISLYKHYRSRKGRGGVYIKRVSESTRQNDGTELRHSDHIVCVCLTNGRFKRQPTAVSC